jgi:nucleotide-binding universal stress UspA family protein
MLFTRVLVPIDFSNASIAALRLAVAIGLRMGARLSLLHVNNDPLPGSDEEVSNTMHRLAATEIPSSVSFDLLFDQGVPAERINHHAEDGQHDLVVMGTHGKTGLERVILGSVAETVVRTCTAPVLVTHDRG